MRIVICSEGFILKRVGSSSLRIAKRPFALTLCRSGGITDEGPVVLEVNDRWDATGQFFICHGWRDEIRDCYFAWKKENRDDGILRERKRNLLTKKHLHRIEKRKYKGGIMNRILLNIKELFKINLLKTVWFNFKMLPLRQAVLLPVYIYGKASFRKTDGQFIIEAKAKPGMIKIGKKDKYVMTSLPYSIWTVEGKITFHSAFRFYGGSYVFCAKNANLSFMGGGFCGSNVKIICFDSITLYDTRVTWDCQIVDTSYHYLEVMDHPGEFKPLTTPIVLGSHVWIGNNSTITKGVVLPDETIVASHSLVNKNFSDIGPYNMLAGVPAVVKKRGIRRIYDAEKEAQLDQLFEYNRTKL